MESEAVHRVIVLSTMETLYCLSKLIPALFCESLAGINGFLLQIT